MEEKQDYRKALFYEKKNGYDRMDSAARSEMESYCEGYKRYLNESRTEREAVANAIKLAEAEGFTEYKRGMALVPGQKVWYNNRGKALMLAVAGKRPLDAGVVIAAAHVDAPRLDLKLTPLYEDSELAFFKDALLRRDKEVPVDRHPAGAARRGGAQIRRGRRGRDRPRAGRAPARPYPTCCRTWPRTR